MAMSQALRIVLTRWSAMDTGNGPAEPAANGHPLNDEPAESSSSSASSSSSSSSSSASSSFEPSSNGHKLNGSNGVEGDSKEDDGRSEHEQTTESGQRDNIVQEQKKKK